MPGDGTLWTETCGISSTVTTVTSVVHDGKILCLIDNIGAQRGEEHKNCINHLK